MHHVDGADDPGRDGQCLHGRSEFGGAGVVDAFEIAQQDGMAAFAGVPDLHSIPGDLTGHGEVDLQEPVTGCNGASDGRAAAARLADEQDGSTGGHAEPTLHGSPLGPATDEAG